MLRRLVFAFVAMIVGACSGTPVATSDPSRPNGPTTTSGGDDTCSSETLTASEVGVSDDTITITVVADTGSPIKPGLFKGSVDGLNAWAAYVNDNGGLACRRVAVKTADSRLSPD